MGAREGWCLFHEHKSRGQFFMSVGGGDRVRGGGWGLGISHPGFEKGGGRA